MTNISSDAQKILANASPEARQWIETQDFGGKLTSGEATNLLATWTTNNTASPELQARIDALPDVLKNDPSFLSLSPDMQEITVYNYEIQLANDQQKATNLADALETATQQAEPYWSSMLLIAQDEVLRSFEEAQGDYDSSLQRQQRIMRNIDEDLTTNKDFLSLEQQSELANLKRNYVAVQGQVIEGAADKGLTFSTKRKIAEQRLAEENQGIVESTNRQYNKQLSDLQTASARDTEEAQSEVEDLQRRMGTYTTSLGRSAETYLGTANLPALPGYQPLGDITGEMYEEKVKDIEVRKDSILDDLNQSSLNFS